YSKGRARGPVEVPRALIERFSSRIALDSLGNRIRAAMTIYYERLHGMFIRIALGRGAEVAEELYGSGCAHAIRPLPGVGVLHALAKGWLGGEAAALTGVLERAIGSIAGGEEKLTALGRVFAAAPAQVALVTSSGDYEADIVLGEVFDGLRDEVAAWP